jgi:L-rhamnose-H+ transport protein
MNPFLGVFFHWLGGLASGSFYVPYRFVKRWSWETYWLVGGVFSWIIAPWVFAGLLTKDLPAVLQGASADCVFWTYFWGVMWGLGGLTFGLTMRYLGMSLGMAVALGYCAAFGTLVPPLFHGEFKTKLLDTLSGQIILVGVGICLAGIAIAGLAGMSKEREMPADQKKATIKEFSFLKGLLVATFSGVMSACFAFGLDAGGPIKELALRHALLHAAEEDGCKIQTSTSDNFDKSELARLGNPDLRKKVEEFKDPRLKQMVIDVSAAGRDPQKFFDKFELWQGLPALIVILLGGFTTNFIWCVLLNVKNGTAYQYLSSTAREGAPRREDETIIESPIDAPSEEVVEHMPRAKAENPYESPKTEGVSSARPNVPLAWNYFFSALAGTTWYMQFFFYSMGETQMGKYKFSSWTLHMASIIIFSTLWGIGLREWKGSSRRTIALVAIGLATLIGSTIVVGYGNYLGTLPTPSQ